MPSYKRALSAGERSTVAAPAGFAFYSFLEVTDADSTPSAPSWKNIGALSVGASSADFLNGLQFADGINQNTLSFSATLARERGVNYSLSPYRSNSILNARADSTFGPLLDIRRYWRVWACAMPIGVKPSRSNYRIWRDGRLDVIDVQEALSLIFIQGRGMEADLIDAYVAVTNRVYGGTPLVDVEDVIQKMLDDQMGSDVVELYAPEAPIGFQMPEWDLDEGSLMPAIVNVATMAAAMTRYRYDSADVNRFTMFTPNRTPDISAPDWTVNHTEYKARPSSRIDVGPVRNFILVKYPDANFGAQTAISPAAEPTTVSVSSEVATFSASPGTTIADGTVIVIDTVGYTVSGYAGGTTATLAGAPDVAGAAWHTSASITRYGVRPLSLDYTGKTQVTTLAAAGNIADAVRADWEDPGLEQTFDLVGWWWLELWDFLQLDPDGIIHNEVTYGAVAGYTMTLANSKLTVSAQLRGRPNAGYRGWLRVGSGVDRVPIEPAILSGTGAFIEWVAPMPVGTFSIELIVAPNQYAKSAIWDLSETADFAVILDTHYSNFIDPFDPSLGAQGELFSIADAGRLKTYYVRVTPYSGHLGGWPLGLPVPPPTGIAGDPYYIVVGTDTLRPTKPQFDVLAGDVATIDADLTALTLEPFTVHAPTLGLPNSRAWVDSSTANVDLSTPGAISLDVVGVAEIAGALGEIGIPIWFYKTPLASAQWLTMATIPASEEEMGTEYRRQHYLAGAGRGRWHAIVKAVTGTPTVKLKSSTDGFATSADVDSLSITGAGYLSGPWTALPGTAQDDVRVSPYLLNGAGTASVQFYALWYEVLPDLVTAFRDFSDDFSDDFS